MQTEPIKTVESLLFELRPEICNAIDKGVNSYIDKLKNFEDQLDDSSANHTIITDVSWIDDNVQSAVREQIFSNQWVEKTSRVFDISEQKAISVLSGTLKVEPQLKLPSPVLKNEISAFKIAVSAAIGAFAGIMILTPITHLLLDMRDIGLLVGPALGAFLLVYAAVKCSKSEKLRKWLIGLLGFSMVFESVMFLFNVNFLTRVWRIINKSKRNLFLKILLYISVLFVLLISKTRKKIDYESTEKSSREVIGQWIYARVFLICSALSFKKKEMTEANNDILYSVCESAVGLADKDPDILQDAVKEFIQKLKNLGFEISKDKDIFQWNKDSSKSFKIFGIINEGDKAIVEEKPIIINGEVIKKGLVRKLRSGSEDEN